MIAPLLALLLGAAAPAAAWDVELRSDTSFQAYEVRSPGTSAFMTRRRLVQVLGLSFARPFDREDDDSPRILGTVSLRLDQDFGDTCLVTRDFCVRATNSEDGGAYQPLAEETRLDAPIAFVELTDLPLGLDVRAGRQLHWDSIGFVRFDGGLARIEPSTWLAAEVLGGLVVRRTSLAGSAAFEPEGSLRLDLEGEGVDPDRVPWVDEPRTAWTAGGAIEVGPRRWARLRVAWRETREGDAVIARRGALGLSSRHLGWPRAGLDGVWDLVDPALIDAIAWAEVDLGPATVRTSVERHVPRFDLGTIWAYFDPVPIDEARAGATVRVGERLTLSGGLRGRRAQFENDGAPDETETDLVVEGDARARIRGIRAGLSGFVGGGDLGPVAGVSFDASREVARGLEIEARASVWHVDDPLREQIFGTSIAEAVGARYTLTAQSTVHLDLEHAASRVAGHRFRFFASLHVEAWR